MTQFIDDSADLSICDGCGSVGAEMPFYLYLVLALRAVALLWIIWIAVKLISKKVPQEQRSLELKWMTGLLVFIPLGVLWPLGIDILWLLGITSYYFWKKQQKRFLALLLAFLVPLTLIATSNVITTNLVSLLENHSTYSAEESIFYQLREYKINTGEGPGSCIKLFYSSMEYYGPYAECKYSIL